jgi:predicted nucleic acid-binding Zn ribbon protein
MESLLQAFSYGVEGLQVHRDWIFGTLSEGDVAKSPLAPRIDIKSAIRRDLSQRQFRLPTLAVFFAPLISHRGFIREVPDDCLVDFMSLAHGDTDSLKAFLRRYGLFAHEHLEKVSGQPKLIRGQWSSAVKSDRIPFSFSLSSFWTERSEFEELQSLWAAVRQGGGAVAALCESLGQQYIQNFNVSDYETVVIAARCAVSAAIAGQLENVRVALTDVGGNLVSTLIASSVKEALFIRLLQTISTGTPLSRCERCGRAFFATKSTKRFCSDKCQAMAKRYRQLGKPSNFHAPPR